MWSELAACVDIRASPCLSNPSVPPGVTRTRGTQHLLLPSFRILRFQNMLKNTQAENWISSRFEQNCVSNFHADWQAPRNVGPYFPDQDSNLCPLPWKAGSLPLDHQSWEVPLEEGMATCSSILAWRIPWTEEPGGLQPMGHKESDTTEQRSTAQCLCWMHMQAPLRPFVVHPNLSQHC